MLLPLLPHWLQFFHLGRAWAPGAPGGPPRIKNTEVKPMKQQRQQHKHLFGQFLQLNIPLPRDVKGLNIPPTAEHPNIPQAPLDLRNVWNRTKHVFANLPDGQSID